MAGCAPNCVKKGAPRECNEFEYKWGLSAVRKRTPGNQAAPSASAVAIAERTKCDTQCCCKAVGAV